MSYFSKKNILITGASSGIGRALAIAMADKEVSILLAARNTEKLAQVQIECLKKGANCEIYLLDVSSEDSIRQFSEQVREKYAQIDVLINNAGISQRSQAEETALQVDRRIMEVNFFGQVHLTKQLWPLLCNSAHANIVLISSVVGTFGFPQRSAYSASKHALEGFFESWMLENTRNNIHFTTVSPGRIQTNISSAALKGDGSSHNKMDDGQLNGIPADVCAAKIIAGIQKNKRKVYIVQKEMILIVLRKLWPSLFIKLVKKLKLA
ncbi:MAG: SDR family oxidoreductase [Sphingobacteriales bacterium]|nr:SDR family oxidoreductase [Sphingobacteriales bacterium]